jgi:AraC-like DNA-binding protein
MKLVFEKVLPKADSSFELLEKRAAAFDGRFHFHPEIEITLIESSAGRRVVGDSIDSFAPGDLVLLGENLPHQYVSNPASADTVAAAKVIKFRADFAGDELLRLPELKTVASMLKRSRRGLSFGGETVRDARKLIERIFAAAGPQRLVLLLQLLDVLSRDRRSTPIASAGYLARISSRESDTVDQALQYLNERFSQPVTLADLSRYLHVSPATCNRLLHKSIGRSFKQALIEIRISHACRLLLSTDRPIVEVAYASGFANLSNFNRRFKQLKGHNPKAYRNLLAR